MLYFFAFVVFMHHNKSLSALAMNEIMGVQTTPDHLTMPMAPPGWFLLNTLCMSVPCNFCAAEIASDCPITSATVALVDGALTPKLTSSNS